MLKQPVSKLVFAFLFLTFFFILIFYSITYQSVKATIESSHADSLNLVAMRNLEGLLDDLQTMELSQKGFSITGNQVHITNFDRGYSECKIHLKNLVEIRHSDTVWQKKVSNLSFLLEDYSSYMKHLMNLCTTGKIREAITLNNSETGFKKITSLRSQIHGFEKEGREFLRISADYKEQNARQADSLFKTFGLIVLIALLLLYFRITFDLRKRSELEFRLKAFNEELSKHVNQKTTELREKNDQLNLFLEHSPAALAMFDLDMNYLVVSKKWSEDFNLGSESLLGKSHYDIFPAMKQWWKDLHERALNGEIIRGNEDTFVSNTGKLEWKRWDVYPWHEPNGKIGGIIIFSQIITEEKKAQQRLLIHDALLSRSEQMGKFGCWETDFLTDRTECSDAYYALTGLPKEEQTSLDKFRTLIHPDDKERFENDIRNIYKQAGIYNHDFRIISADGKGKYIHSSLEVYFSSDGKLLRAFGVMQDVTERRKAEEVIKASEERYRMLIEHAGDGIIVSDREGEIHEMNPSFTKLTGFTKEYRGRTLNVRDFTLIQKDEPDLRFEELANGQSLLTVRTGNRADGTTFIAEANTKILPNGLYLSFIKDITERVTQAKALIESENRFRTIFESEPECVKLMDENCILINMNPAGLEMIEADGLESVKGKSVIGIVNPEFREAYLQMSRDVYTGKSISLEFEITTLKGKRKILSTTCVPMRDSDFKIVSILSVTTDISAKKLAELKLAASESRFRSIIEQFPYPVASYNIKGDISSTNKAWEELWVAQKADFEGYNILHDPLVVEAGLMPSTHRAFNGEIIETEPFLYEPSRMGKSGRSRWIIATLFPLKTSEGELLEVIEIVQDVTDKIAAEEELKQSEEKYRTLVEEANDGIFIGDRDGKFIVVNPSGCKLSQYTFEELQNMTLYDLVLKDDLIKRPFRFDEMYLGKVVHSERRMIRKDGTMIDVELSAKFISDTKFLCFVRDVTESKKAQNEIKKSNDRFNLIANATNDALYEWNLDTNEIWWSESHFLMFGFDPSKPIPSQEDWLSKIHPDDRNLLFEQLDAAINKRIQTSSTIIRYLNSDGQYGTLLQRCTLTGNHDSLKGTVVGSFVDITVKMKIEEELRLKEKAIATSISGMGMADLHGFITYANETLWKMWNYPSSEALIGKHLTEVFYGDKINETITNLKTRGYDHGEDIGEKADGTLFNVAFSANIISDQKGEPICLFGSFIDITARKKAEDAIRQSESKYRLLFDLSPLPKFVFDENTFDILDVNNAACEHYGYSRAELLNMQTKDIIAPEDRVKFPKEIISGKAMKKGGLWNHLTNGNKKIQVEIFTHKLLYNDVPAWLVLANDVTKEIAQKELLEQTTAQLRQLAAHLQDIREEERTNIAREIHDEMGQQLTALKMDLSYIRKKCDKNDSLISSRIDAAMIQVDETIRSIRRISTDLHPGILEDLGLVAALEWQAQEFESRTGIKTDFIDRSSDKTINKNISRAIFRIFQESLTNIARHSSAKSASAVIEVKDDELLLLMSDDGKGFDLAELKHGKSLGLVGIKERVILMNGRYTIESKPGNGTKIQVAVPLNGNV